MNLPEAVKNDAMYTHMDIPSERVWDCLLKKREINVRVSSGSLSFNTFHANHSAGMYTAVCMVKLIFPPHHTGHLHFTDVTGVECDRFQLYLVNSQLKLISLCDGYQKVSDVYVGRQHVTMYFQRHARYKGHFSVAVEFKAVNRFNLPKVAVTYTSPVAGNRLPLYFSPVLLLFLV